MTGTYPVDFTGLNWSRKRSQAILGPWHNGSMAARFLMKNPVLAIGMLMFALAMWIVGKVLPFSLRKEIEEDQNTSLGIVLGAIIIGLAMIISTAIK